MIKSYLDVQKNDIHKLSRNKYLKGLRESENLSTKYNVEAIPNISIEYGHNSVIVSAVMGHIKNNVVMTADSTRFFLTLKI